MIGFSEPHERIEHAWSLAVREHRISSVLLQLVIERLSVLICLLRQHVATSKN